MRIAKTAIVLILLMGFSTNAHALFFWNKDKTEDAVASVPEKTVSEKEDGESKSKLSFLRLPFLNKDKDDEKTAAKEVTDPKNQNNGGAQEAASTDSNEVGLEENETKKSLLSRWMFFKKDGETPETETDIENVEDETLQNPLSFLPLPFLNKKNEIKPVIDTENLPEGEDNFSEGYRLFEKKKYYAAAHHLYAYLSKHDPDDEGYEWAEFFFGISLDKLGLSHAATDVLTHLVKRRPNPKITSYALEMFELTTRTQPYDQDKIINQVLCDEEYGFVESHLTDFINYHKGVFDWEHGFFEWGERHFGAITPDSYYYYKYLYQKTLLNIYRDEIDSAITNLKLILDGVPDEDRFKDEVRQTLARLLYEKEDYTGARKLYMEIQIPVLEQAEHLLERAWVQYRAGEYEKAMGLLYAFRAPCYRNYFTPEYFILKSFIYKGVCHYQEALSVIDDFNDHYGQALDMIYHREEIKANRMLLLVIINKHQINFLWQFLEMLEIENAYVESFPDSELKAYLTEIYELQLLKTGKEFKLKVQNEYEKMANNLLQYEEESHLLEYEIGLDMYERVQQYHYKKEQDDVAKTKTKDRTVAYPFQGEFWTYELDDYKVTLPSKCECSEEWDVFFK